MKPFVYVAGPIASHPMHNAHRALKLCTELYKSGLVLPFSPHVSVLWDIVVPMSYESWLEYDLDVIAHMHAIYRMEGESPGADRECSAAVELGLPVFLVRDELYAWAAGWRSE